MEPLPPAVRRTRSGGQPPEFASVPPPAAQYVPAFRHTQPAQSSFAGHECILAWDYENLALPSSLEAGAAATKRLLELARRFGRVTQCRVYHDSAKVSGDIAAKHRSSLDALGFTIVDCPTSDKKEALDKKVLVDVALFAAATQAPRSVVLAASDGDYAYLLSRCRQLGVHCVNVRGEQAREEHLVQPQRLCGRVVACLKVSCVQVEPRPRRHQISHLLSELGGGGRVVARLVHVKQVEYE